MSAFHIKASQCPAKIQLTHFFPNSCYYNSENEECIDRCLGTLPGGSPKCFTDLQLPCDVRDDLFESAASVQVHGDDSWVHVSDLLDFSALKSDLYIVRKKLFQDLYKHYVQPPVVEGYSGSTKQLIKENFRLSAIDNTKRIVSPLKSAAVFKRLTLGKSLESSVNIEYENLEGRIDIFPFFSASEKLNLFSELSAIKNNELKFWQFIKAAAPSLVQNSRVSYLNSQLDNLATKINALDDQQLEYMINKSNELLGFNFRECDAGVCVNDIFIDGGNYYNELDVIHTLSEVTINNLLDEAQALQRTVGSDLNFAGSNAPPPPDFSGLMSSKLNAYLSNPDVERLKELEVAINVAFLQLGVDGLELFELLKLESAEHIEGVAYLSPFEDKKTLLCQTFENINVELQEIQQETFSATNKSRDIIKQMLEQGHSPDLINELEQVVLHLSDLALRSQMLSSVDRFSLDRHINISWDLSSNTAQWDSQLYQLQIEFIAYDGLHWIPSVSTPLMDLIPGIAGISTIKGSLLPSAKGPVAGLQVLTLTLRQSPYTACSSNNNNIKLIVKLTDQNGVTKRYTLTAILDQL